MILQQTIVDLFSTQAQIIELLERVLLVLAAASTIMVCGILILFLELRKIWRELQKRK